MSDSVCLEQGEAAEIETLAGWLAVAHEAVQVEIIPSWQSRSLLLIHYKPCNDEKEDPFVSPAGAPSLSFQEESRGKLVSCTLFELTWGLKMIKMEDVMQESGTWNMELSDMSGPKKVRGC